MGDDPAAASRADARLRAAGITPETPLVVIHVSAGNPFRRWPPASFQAADRGARAARPGSSYPLDVRDRPTQPPPGRLPTPRGESLGALAASVPDLGDFDLHELRAIIARAAAYVGGDSGPLHVAATTTVPVVALLGPTLPERSKPWRDPRWFVETLDHALPCRPCHQRTCEPGDFRCLTWTTAEQVIAGRRARHCRRRAQGGRA